MKKLFTYFVIISILAYFNQNIGSCQDFIYKNYSVSEGLPSSEIYHCLQDSKGFIWFATDNGVSKFDGYKFVNFDIQNGLINNTVFDIYEDWKKRIWFISLTSKLCYYENNRIIEYPYNDLIAKKIKGAPLPVKQSFYIDSLDNVYISVRNNGIFKISPKGKIEYAEKVRTSNFIYFDSINESTFISGFRADRNLFGIIDNLRIVPCKINLQTTNWTLLFHFRDKNKKTFFCFDKRIFRVDFDSIKELIAFDKDIIWFSKDKYGNFWVSIRGHGIRFYNNTNFSGKGYTTYLDGKDVSSVMIDNENNYWFTTLNDGVYMLSSSKIQFLDLSKHSSNHVLSIELSPTRFWIGLNNGELLSYDNQLLNLKESIRLNDYDLPQEIIYHKKFKKLIIGTLHKVLKYNGTQLEEMRNRTLKNKPYLKYLRTVRCLSEGLGDYFYVGSNYSIDKFDKDGVINSSDFTIGMNKIVYSIIENADSSLWIGTHEGLWKYEKGKYISFGSKNKILAQRVNSLFLLNNVLYVGTKGAGLVMMNVIDNSIKVLTVRDGLSSNSIQSIVGSKDEIWLGTTNGVTKIKFIADDTFQISKIDNENGLLSNEINQLILNDSILYIASKKGLNFINIKTINLTSNPRLYIEKVNINSKDTCVMDNYELGYFQNNIDISFVAVSYINHQNLQYRYRLLPLEKEWKRTYHTSVNYTTLPPGKYQFEIKAKNDIGIWSDSFKNIYITINKPFWLKWWFYLVILLVVVLIVYLIIHNRVQTLKYQNKLKNELNNNVKKSLSLVFNDHFIFNSLNSLNHLILSGNKADSSKLLTRFSNYIRAVLYSVKNDFISLSDEVNLIKIYLDIEKQRLKEKLNYSIEISSKLNLNQLFIPGILIQPFIEALIWTVNLSDHEQLKINIDFAQNSDKLKISIQTTIKSMLREIENINGQVNFQKFEQTVELIKTRAKLINELYSLEIEHKSEPTNPSYNERFIVLEIPINNLLHSK